MRIVVPKHSPGEEDRGDCNGENPPEIGFTITLAPGQL